MTRIPFKPRLSTGSDQARSKETIAQPQFMQAVATYSGTCGHVTSIMTWAIFKSPSAASTAAMFLGSMLVAADSFPACRTPWRYLCARQERSQHRVRTSTVCIPECEVAWHEVHAAVTKPR